MPELTPGSRPLPWASHEAPRYSTPVRYDEPTETAPHAPA